MKPMRRPIFARCLLPFFLLLCVVVCAGCAQEPFAPTTDLDNFQKLQQQKEQAEVKPEVQAVTPAAVTADNPADYLLGAGDLITVTVFESAQPERRGTGLLARLRQPAAARQRRGGRLTAAEAEERIERLYAARYLHDPHVTVYIKEHVSKQITLVGSLVKPGTYDYVSRRRLLDVIAIARGSAKMPAPPPMSAAPTPGPTSPFPSWSTWTN